MQYTRKCDFDEMISVNLSHGPRNNVAWSNSRYMASKIKKPALAFLHAIVSQGTSQRGFNAIYKAIQVKTHGIDFLKSEKSFPRTKDVCTVSSNATFNRSKRCADIGVVIREGLLPILCIAARIACTNSQEGVALGIALGVKKATDIGIYDFEVRMDCWEAYQFLKSTETLVDERNERNVTATELLEEARRRLKYKNLTMSCKVILQEENKSADHLSRIAATMEVGNEKTWETKVPRGLREILIEDVAITKVHFEPSSGKIPLHLVKFKLLDKEMDGKGVGNKERFQKKNIIKKWFEVLVEQICKKEIQFILVRCRVPAEIFCEINIHINYNENRCPEKKEFEMSKKDLRCFYIFKTLVEEGPEKCCIEVYMEPIKKTEEDKEKYLIYSREDIRLPACEMTVKDYDFGICEMMVTVTCPQKASNMADISDDLMMLRQLEEDSDGLEPRRLLKVGETLNLP